MLRTLPLLLLAGGCAAPPIWTSHEHLLHREILRSGREEWDKLARELRDLGFRDQEGFTGSLSHTLLLDGPRWIFVWVWFDGKVPGGSKVRLGVMDGQGRILSDEHFYSGWRPVELEGVERVPAKNGRPDLLLIRMQGMVMRDRRYFFALVGDQLELVRLEGAGERKPAVNYYSHPNITIGPLHPPRDEADCLRDLEQGSWARRLSLLTWLAGEHWDGTDPEVWHEDEAMAALALRLQASPRIRAAVKKLSRAEDAWLREAAGVLVP